MTESELPTNGAGHQPTMSVTVDNDGDGAIVVVRGEIDLDTCTDLRSALEQLDPARKISLDLGEVSYIDSTGLRVLLTARDAAQKAGGSLAVSATSSIVARLIEITGVDDLLHR